jgi:hypothetical protein
MVLVFVETNGKTILQKVEMFDTIVVADDLKPYTPVKTDLDKMTKENLIDYARILGVKFNRQSMPKASMVKLLVEFMDKNDIKAIIE